jgi:hypothetical protein
MDSILIEAIHWITRAIEITVMAIIVVGAGYSLSIPTDSGKGLDR